MKKTFKTLDEQMSILESKGLIITDYDKTSDILFKENYFFINGYRHFLLKEDGSNQFVDGATFEELYSLFLFDRNIRNIMFKYILVIENNIKSMISYQLSKKYGYKEHDYLNPKHFRQESFKLTQVNDVINKMKRQIRLNAKQHSATKHYLTNYGYIPIC
jgi:abortive infection bacteriophage resistance protein